MPLGKGGFTSRAVRVNGSYRPVTGDFDGDGDTDVFWYAPGAGRDVIWWSAGGRFSSAVAPAVNA